MRWDNLFDDLESQLEGEMRADETELLVEEERLRLARLSLRERLVALTSSRHASPLRLVLSSGIRIEIAPATVGRDWISGGIVGEGASRGHAIVPFSALEGLLLNREQVSASIGHAASDRGDGLAARLGLGYVLRDLCRRRSSVDIVTAGGVAHGTIDRVGRDHLDLAVHEVGAPRRDSAVLHYRMVPLDVIQYVRSG